MKSIKFDVMLHGKFLRTLKMPITLDKISGYDGNKPIVGEGAFIKYVAEVMPSVAKNTL